METYEHQFLESNEDLGILYNSYKDLVSTVKSFLKEIDDSVENLIKSPEKPKDDLKQTLAEFKTKSKLNLKPEPIPINHTGKWKLKLQKIRTEMNQILEKYAKLKDRTAFGGNYLRAVIMRPKVYSKKIDPETYTNINENIHSVHRSLDWAEKVILDLYNLIDQDINIVTMVQRVYARQHIYESTQDEYEMLFGDGTMQEEAVQMPASEHIRKQRDRSIQRAYYEEYLPNRYDWADPISLSEYIHLRKLGILPDPYAESFGTVPYMEAPNTKKEDDQQTEEETTEEEPPEMMPPEETSEEIPEDVMDAPAEEEPPQEEVPTETPAPETTKEPPTEEPAPAEQPTTEEQPPAREEEQPKKETPPQEDTVPVQDVKPLSRPKQTDAAEADKNGVRRKKLYIAFIEWAKAYNPKNVFGSIFDKDVFKVSYPFVPHEMRYFYRLANPILCVLAGQLTFFQVSELRKLNAENPNLNEMMIFAATPNDLRVFYTKDQRVYQAQLQDGQIHLIKAIGDSFDLYLQAMIQQGDILNGPIEDPEPPKEAMTTEEG